MVCLLFCTSCSFYICPIWKYGFNCFVISNFFDFVLSVLLSIFLSTLKAVNIKVWGGGERFRATMALLFVLSHHSFYNPPPPNLTKYQIFISSPPPPTSLTPATSTHKHFTIFRKHKEHLYTFLLIHHSGS